LRRVTHRINDVRRRLAAAIARWRERVRDPQDRFRRAGAQLERWRWGERLVRRLPKSWVLLPDASNWGWVHQLSADDLREVGDTTLALLEHGAEWVHRRVETITYVDDAVVRRQLTIDFSLPRWLQTCLRTPSDDPVYFVPVTLLQRRSGRMKFDVRDEAGNALPLMSRRENARVTGAALVELARRVVRSEHGPPDEQLLGALAHIATRPYRRALPYVRSVLNPNSLDWYDRLPESAAAQRHTLRNHETFPDYLCLFAKHSVVVVPMIIKPGTRHIVKLSFEEELVPTGDDTSDDDREGTRRSIRDRVATRIGWSPTFTIPRLPLVGLAQSYHVQIMPPPNVELTEVGLSAERPRDSIRAAVFRNAPAGRARPVYRRFHRGFRSRGHLYVEDSPQLATGVAWAGLRAERRGLLMGAAIAGALVAAVLGFFALATDEIARQPSSASSLLLLAPVLITAYLLRPGEHAMARQLLVWPRFFLMGSAALSFVAAAAVIALLPANADRPLEPGRTAASGLSSPRQGTGRAARPRARTPARTRQRQRRAQRRGTGREVDERQRGRMRSEEGDESQVGGVGTLKDVLAGLALGALFFLALLAMSVWWPRPQRMDRGEH
jgi:hypothetical protein